MNTYVIAVKREMRGAAPADWASSVTAVPGISVCGDTKGPRIQVEASPEAIREIKDRVGDFCHIEPLIEHYPSK